MNKIIYITTTLIFILIIGIGAIFLINQKNTINNLNSEITNLNAQLTKISDSHDKELATKIIIQTYNELIKAGQILSDEPVGLISKNMKIVSNSYTGEDQDVKNMLIKVQDYLDYRMYYLDLNTPFSERTKGKGDLSHYIEVIDSIDKCISKYALFDQIGLYE